jgi:hypothetical protein
MRNFPTHVCVTPISNNLHLAEHTAAARSKFFGIRTLPNSEWRIYRKVDILFVFSLACFIMYILYEANFVPVYILQRHTAR